VSVVIVYAAYLMVTVPALVHRLRGTDGATSPQGYFTLGRWGLPVNLVAVGMGAFLLINIAWPRAEIYDIEGGHWYLQYFPIEFLAGLLLVGFIAYRRVLREHGVTTHGVIDLTQPRDPDTAEPVEHLTTEG
jgi:hypothetical protein